MSRVISLIVLAFVLVGCASDTAVLRIVEYRVGTVIAAVGGNGIAVHQAGAEHAFARVQITYESDKGTVIVDTHDTEALSCPSEQSYTPESVMEETDKYLPSPWSSSPLLTR